MLIAAAFCPHPPVLLPEVSRGAAPELDGLRTACDRSVAAMLATGPDRLVVVGSAARGAAAATYPADAVGSLSGFGVDVTVGRGAGRPVLPLSLTVGGWLLDRAGYAGPLTYAAVDRAGVGAPAADDELSTGWLVMGDASACRTASAPGSYDPRAEAFDASVATALAGGDQRALGAFDPTLADELVVAGLGPWRAVGAAWGDRRAARATLDHDSAPYGVGYLVATWCRD